MFSRIYGHVPAIAFRASAWDFLFVREVRAVLNSSSLKNGVSIIGVLPVSSSLIGCVGERIDDIANGFGCHFHTR